MTLPDEATPVSRSLRLRRIEMLKDVIYFSIPSLRLAGGSASEALPG